MIWIRKSHIFVPDGSSDWMHSYAQVPTPVVLDDRIRVFFSTRPRNMVDGAPVAYIGFVDISKANCAEVLAVSNEPVIPLGSAGTFDEYGTHPVSAVRMGNEVRLYYVGWTRLQSVPYNRAIGLAVSYDHGRTFRRYGSGPIVGPTSNEPFLQQGPSVKKLGDEWHMWYLGGIRWLYHESRYESVYQIMHATSKDGIHWHRDGKTIIDPLTPNECQAGQAVIERDNKYHMWFSYRPGLDFRNAENGYRLGYAWSEDLETWYRDDSMAGLSPSDHGWDSEMICYPQICELGDRTLLFYSGNYFGKDGFGYAQLDM